MGRKNYSKHFVKKTEPEVLEGQVGLPLEDELIAKAEELDEATVEGNESVFIEAKVAMPKGKVNCEKLYVRTEPNKKAEHLCVIEKSTEVEINLEESTEEFYKIYTSFGVEGYCMKNFISVE